MDKILTINKVIREFFATNRFINKVPAKDLMPEFIEAGVFDKDKKKGLPIRAILRELDTKKQLHQIPSVLPERKKVYTYWFFVR